MCARGEIYLIFFRFIVSCFATWTSFVAHSICCGSAMWICKVYAPRMIGLELNCFLLYALFFACTIKSIYCWLYARTGSGRPHHTLRSLTHKLFTYVFVYNRMWNCNFVPFLAAVAAVASAAIVECVFDIRVWSLICLIQATQPSTMLCAVYLLCRQTLTACTEGKAHYVDVTVHCIW